MRAVIHEEIFCNHKNMKKYLPERYAYLVNRNFYGQTVTVIYFPIDEKITGKMIEKSINKVKNINVKMLYFAYRFTTDAITMIKEHNGTAFELSSFLWG